MEEFSLSFEERDCRIRCSVPAFKLLSARREEFLRRGGMIFTDSHVAEKYAQEIEESLGGIPLSTAPPGEEFKNEETLFSLLKEMAEAGLRRDSVLIAMGGGVVCDLGGLAASLYMRGISCILVPTTLLAQADACVGGKTAIDAFGIKNLVGTFRLPDEALIDGEFLNTLPAREIKCGLGEIVKHGALYPPLFEKISAGKEKIHSLPFLKELIPENVAFKTALVRKDPLDRGLRRCLNLGHTTAHALEPGSGLTHGECVLWGLMAESSLAQNHFSCDGEFLENLKELCLIALGGTELKYESSCFCRALKDKKNDGAGKVVLTVPVSCGRYEILSLPYEEYVRETQSALRKIC